jgi:hypothetical protein
MVSSSDTVAETSTHYPKVEGLNPASAAGRTRTEKFAKNPKDLFLAISSKYFG